MLSWTRWLAAILLGMVVVLQVLNRGATADIKPGAYKVTSPAIQAYFDRHGGAGLLGAPISNEFLLGGNRVQLFERQGIEVRPDGSVGIVNLMDKLPLVAPDAGLVARAPRSTDKDYFARATQFFEEATLNTWRGERVEFNSAYRASLTCKDLVGVQACNDRVLLALELEVWGLPIAQPTADPRNPDLLYQWFERGGLVHSRSSGATGWLRLGLLFKDSLVGAELTPELIERINASQTAARFYAQYDPLADDGLARPDDLPNTSLADAFAPAPAEPSKLTIAARAEARLPLDQHFGVAEGFRDPGTMTELGMGWERIVLPWDDIQPRSADDFSRLGKTFPPDKLASELARGVRVAAVLQATPAWARSNPAHGNRSVPKNLDLPFDDPRNTWGHFVYQTVRHYAGRIDEWILWNEPDVRAEDPGGAENSTWAGTPDEFARLLQVGYLAAKKANPRAKVVFPATTYWADETSRPKRPQFYDRVLAALTRDPAAPANGFYHDAVALNLYMNPDDVYRVFAIFSGIQRRYAIDKPVWLTEFNLFSGDDPRLGCKAAERPRTTLEQQAAYAVQTAALAAAAGYQRIQFFQMSDGNACQGQAWGLIRGDGSRRPAADALRQMLGLVSGFRQAHFVPLAREQKRWPTWPDDPASYLPNWQVYQVAFDKPGGQRVTVLWNGNGGQARAVRIRRAGQRALLVDIFGGQRSLVARDGWYDFQLPPASASQPTADVNDPTAYHVIGGAPVFLIEEGVPT